MWVISIKHVSTDRDIVLMKSTNLGWLLHLQEYLLQCDFVQRVTLDKLEEANK